MKRLARRLDDKLRVAGVAIGRLWCTIAALIVLLSFPAIGFIASVYAGLYIADLTGLGAYLGLVIALSFGVFLSVYVWEPLAKKRMIAAADLLRDD